MKTSTVKLSEVRADNDLFRIDADYWRPDLIKNSRLISKKQKIGDFVCGQIANIKSSPIDRDFEYLEISKISTTACAYETTTIAVGSEPDRAHYILKRGDIAVSTVRPNRSAVAFVEKDGVVGSSGLSILRAAGIEPEYLFVFCKTRYFVNCLVRANKATMYPAVSNEDVLNTPLLVASAQFRSSIAGIFQNSLACLKEAKKRFINGENTLLSELGLAKWQPKHEVSFVKNYSEIENAGRIDADYFQPKYAEIARRIKSYTGGWEKLENFVLVKDANFMPEPDQRYEYIELANIASQGEIAGHMSELGEDLPGRARRKVTAGDVIVSSIEGSLSSIALVQQEHDQAVCSTGFHVIKSEELNSETLLLLMQSIVGQLQLEKGCKGTILTAISKDELGQIVLPKIRAQIQEKIRQEVAETFKLRAQSKHLLKCAKNAVEMAIEKDEKAAMRWLKDNAEKAQS